MKSDAKKVPKQAKAKRDGVINQKKNQSILTRKSLKLSKRYESTEFDRILGSLWITNIDTHQVVEI